MGIVKILLSAESNVASIIKSAAVFLALIFSLSKPFALFSAGETQGKSVEANGPTLQNRYDALTAPGIIMLPISGTSSVSANILDQIERELFIQFVNNGRIKPVRMQNWLLSTYANKANNPFVIINNIREERFVFPLQYIGKPVVFRNDNQYYFVLYIYFLETYYPITVFRHVASLDDIENIILSCIEELNVRLTQPVSGSIRRRVIIDDFKLDLYRLVQLSSGEFDFISTPFIERNGMAMREGDDFFSRIMGYVLESTNLFQVIHAGDFREYSNSNIGASSNLADYRIRGRVLLSDYECVLYIDVINIRSGEPAASIRHPLLSYSFDNVWDAYRKISVQIIETLFDPETYGTVPTLTESNRGFFSNNMFIGWNTLDNFILARGLHIIATGSRYRIEDAGSNPKEYYILLDGDALVFTDMPGRHIWNLLRK
jgi:hypothetical protein